MLKPTQSCDFGLENRKQQKKLCSLNPCPLEQLNLSAGLHVHIYFSNQYSTKACIQDIVLGSSLPKLLVLSLKNKLSND